MKTQRNTRLMWIICFSVIAIALTLLVSPGLIRAESPGAAKIPIIIQPDNGVFKFKLNGREMNYFFESSTPGQDTSAGASLKLTLTKGKEITRPLSKVLNGFAQNSENRTDSSHIFLQKDWPVILGKGTFETKIKAATDVTLSNNKYTFKDDVNFDIEIHSNSIVAHLLLSPNSAPQSDNQIKLTQTYVPAGSLLEYNFKETAITSGPENKITVLFLSKDLNKIHKAISMDVEKVKDKTGYWGSVIVPEGGKELKVIAMVTSKSNAIIKYDDIVKQSKTWGIIIGLSVVLVFLLFIKVIKAAPFSSERDPARHAEWMKKKSLKQILFIPFIFCCQSYRALQHITGPNPILDYGRNFLLRICLIYQGRISNDIRPDINLTRHFRQYCYRSQSHGYGACR